MNAETGIPLVTLAVFAGWILGNLFFRKTFSCSICNGLILFSVFFLLWVTVFITLGTRELLPVGLVVWGVFLSVEWGWESSHRATNQ